MSTNIDIKVLGNRLRKITKKLISYSAFIAVILVLGAYAFIVYRIGSLANHEPDADVVTERLAKLKKPGVDQSTIDKIQQLQDDNVQVKSLFDQARDNPFQD